MLCLWDSNARLDNHLTLQAELAACLADGQCRENLICLQNCNGREDESQCQVSSWHTVLALLCLRNEQRACALSVQGMQICA